MNIEEMIYRVEKLVNKRAYRVSDFFERGSTRAVANIVMGLSTATAVSKVSDDSHPWDQHFAVGKIVEIFDDSPSTMSAAMMISYIESVRYGKDPALYENLIAMASSIDSAGMFNMITRYDEIVRKVHGNPRIVVSTIMMVIDIYKMIEAINRHDRLELSFRNNVVIGKGMREYSGNTIFYGNEAHPVVRDLHKHFLDKLRVLRDQELNDVA